MYAIEIFASNDHSKLQKIITSWLRFERPKRIAAVEFVADGAEFTYAVLVLYIKSKDERETRS